MFCAAAMVGKSSPKAMMGQSQANRGLMDVTPTKDVQKEAAVVHHQRGPGSIVHNLNGRPEIRHEEDSPVILRGRMESP
ncbi:hypothetical protein GE21DRAFT_1355650 [Neurospora crassa]|nr:hypothetical protein GE21DRAFT_1355650 [Neurospora crassa]